MNKLQNRSNGRRKYLIFSQLATFCSIFHPFFTTYFSWKRLIFRQLEKIPAHRRRKKIKIKTAKLKNLGVLTDRHRTRMSTNSLSRRARRELKSKHELRRERAAVLPGSSRCVHSPERPMACQATGSLRNMKDRFAPAEFSDWPGDMEPARRGEIRTERRNPGKPLTHPGAFHRLAACVRGKRDDLKK
jgi:hypothetical protein